MAPTLNIDTAELYGGDQTSTRRVICVSQGDWFCPLLGYRAKPGDPVTLEDFIGYCRRSGRDQVLERLHAKASRGASIHLDERCVSNSELRQALAAADPAVSNT